MKTNNYLGLLAITVGLTILSCNKDDDSPSFSGAQDVRDESLTDAYYQDLDGLANSAMASVSDEEFSGGRKSVEIELDDYRICSETVVSIIPDDISTIDNPSGRLVIAFGTTGCEDSRGNIRKGTVIFTYSGWRLNMNSTVVTTLEDYSINGILLSGVRTSTNITEDAEQDPSFRVTLTEGKATFPDQSFTERESDFTWTWERAENPVNDQIVVRQGSTASGRTRSGNLYTVAVLGDIIYPKLCPNAVEGIKQIVVNEGRQFTIDYGTGECDREIMVSTGTRSHQVRL